jgi:hypothetical protein
MSFRIRQLSVDLAASGQTQHVPELDEPADTLLTGVAVPDIVGALLFPGQPMAAQAVQARGGPQYSVGGYRCRRRKGKTVNLHEYFRSRAGTERSFIHSVTTHP